MSLVRLRPEAPRCRSSGAICGRSSSGRARPCQGRGSEFEPRRPLHKSPPIWVVIFFACSSALTVVSAGSQPLPRLAVGTLPRNRLASSAAGGASALSSSPAPKKTTTLWVVVFFGAAILLRKIGRLRAGGRVIEREWGNPQRFPPHTPPSLRYARVRTTKPVGNHINHHPLRALT